MALVTQLLPGDQVCGVRLRSTAEHYCEGLRSSLEAAQKKAEADRTPGCMSLLDICCLSYM